MHSFRPRQNYSVSGQNLRSQQQSPQRPTEIPFDLKTWTEMFGYSSVIEKFGMTHEQWLSNLRLTDVGSVSMAKPLIRTFVINSITNWCRLRNLDPSVLTVTESHAGLGGFTVGLARIFRKVICVEIDPLHSEILLNNLGWFRITNVDVFTGDYLSYMNTLSQDIIVSDPPWGGLSYGRNPRLNLSVSGVDIVEVINRLYTNNRFKLFCLFCPVNFDLQGFRDNIRFPTFEVVGSGKHYVILVPGR